MSNPAYIPDKHIYFPNNPVLNVAKKFLRPSANEPLVVTVEDLEIVVDVSQEDLISHIYLKNPFGVEALSAEYLSIFEPDVWQTLETVSYCSLIRRYLVNPLQDDKVLDWSKLK